MSIRDLSRVFQESPCIQLENESKIVVVSDIHRGDGSYSDSVIANRNIYKAALNYYYKEGYTLIEAGDGDELWKNSNYRDIAYNYKDIFSILNKFNIANRLYLLYGNHDSCKKNKDFAEKQKRKLNKIYDGFGKELTYLLSNMKFLEGIVLNCEGKNKKIFITHGHQVDFMNYELCGVSRFLVRYIWRVLEGIAGFKEPTSPANNYKKGGNVDKILEDWAIKNEVITICGHTHNSRFSDIGEGLYFNDGCCVLPYSISTIEIISGLIALVKWNIEVREDNSLYIRKTIIGGPEKIELYYKNINGGKR